MRASVARLTHLLENEEPIEVLGGWARLPGSRKGQRSVSYTGVCEEHGLGKGLEGERVGFGERSSGVRRRSFDEGVLRRDDKKVEKRSGADVRLTEITFGGPEEALRTGREGAEQASAEQTPAEPEVATTEPTLGSATDSDNSEAHGRNVAADVTGEIADAIADPIGANGNVTEFEVEKGLEDGNIVCRAGWPRDKLEMPGFEGLAAKGASARAVTTAEIPGGTGERNGLSASEERLGKDGGAEGLQTERQRKAGRKSVNAVVDSGEEAETGSANRTESEKGSDGFVDHEGEHKHIGAGLQTERGPRSGTEVLQSTVEAAVSEPAITGVRKGDPGTRLLYEAVGDCDRKKARPKGREPKDDQSKISELIETSAKVDIPAPLGELPGFRRPALLTEALLLSSIGTGESAGSHGTEGRGESQREGREPNREEGKQVLHHKSGRASDGERKGLQPVSAARSNDKKDSERASGRLFNVTAKTAESPQKRVSYGTKLPGQRASFEFDRRSRDSQSDSDQDHWSGWRILRKEPEAKQPPRQIRKSSGRTPETEGPAGESRIFRKAPAPEKKRASGNSERRATDERRTSLSSTRVSRASDDVRLTKPAAPVESTKT